MTNATSPLLTWQVAQYWNGCLVMTGQCTSTIAYNLATDMAANFNGPEVRDYKVPTLAAWLDAQPGQTVNLTIGNRTVGISELRAIRLPYADAAPEGKPQVMTPAADMAPLPDSIVKAVAHAPARVEPAGGYEIVDRQTGRVVGHVKTLRAALRSIDRRDNAYGGYRYTHRAVR